MFPSKHSGHRLPISPAARRVAGFTLIELLVVIGILSGLAAILVPIINSGRRVAKIAATKNLIAQIELAIDRFSEDQGYSPPDKIPANTPAKSFTKDVLWDASTGSGGYAVSFPETLQSSEALYYCLANPYVTAQSPYLELQLGSEAQDVRGKKLPQIIDRWGRALEYHRNPYLTNAQMPNVFPGVTNLSTYDDSVAPTHNTTSYDLWSYGPTGYMDPKWITNWK